jgi:hypothetical protein
MGGVFPELKNRQDTSQTLEQEEALQSRWIAESNIWERELQPNARQAGAETL